MDEQKKPKFNVEPRTKGSPKNLGSGHNKWQKEIRQRKFLTNLFALTIIGLFLFIGTVLYIYYKDPSHGTPLANDPDVPPAPTVTPSGLDDFVAPSDTMMMDDLKHLPGLPGIAKGKKPLTGNWVRQAAEYLNEAKEQAQSNQPVKALENYTKALEIFPDLQGVYQEMGLIYLKENNFSSARMAFEKALSEENGSPGIMNNLGVAKLRLNRFEEAEELFRNVLEADPDYHPAQYNLGMLHIRNKDYPKAEKAIRTYITSNKKNTKAYYAFAFVLIQLEEWSEATEVLLYLADLHPDSPPVFFKLAKVMTRTNQQDDAIKALEKGSALLDPRNALALINQDEYETLRTHPEFQDLAASLDQGPEF